MPPFEAVDDRPFQPEGIPQLRRVLVYDIAMYPEHIAGSWGELQTFFRNPTVSPHTRCHAAELFYHLRAIASHPGRPLATQAYVDFEIITPTLEDRVRRSLDIDNLFYLPMERLRDLLAKRAFLTRARLFPHSSTTPVHPKDAAEHARYITEGGEECILDAEFLNGLTWRSFLAHVARENEAVTAWEHARATLRHGCRSPPYPPTNYAALLQIMAGLVGWTVLEAVDRITGALHLFRDCRDLDFHPAMCEYERWVWTKGLTRRGEGYVVPSILPDVSVGYWRSLFQQWYADANGGPSLAVELAGVVV